MTTSKKKPPVELLGLPVCADCGVRHPHELGAHPADIGPELLQALERGTSSEISEERIQENWLSLPYPVRRELVAGCLEELELASAPEGLSGPHDEGALALARWVAGTAIEAYRQLTSAADEMFDDLERQRDEALQDLGIGTLGALPDPRAAAKKAFRCPACGSVEVETELLGFDPSGPDPNKKTCHSCGHVFGASKETRADPFFASDDELGLSACKRLGRADFAAGVDRRQVLSNIADQAHLQRRRHRALLDGWDEARLEAASKK